MAGKQENAQGEDIREKLRGHDRMVIDDGEGNEYVVRYPAKVVKEMEAAGVTAESVSDILGAGTLTGVEDFIERFVLPGFKTEQPKMTKAKAVELFKAVPDKGEFIQLLIGLYSLPTLALTTDPTETRAKFRLA